MNLKRRSHPSSTLLGFRFAAFWLTLTATLVPFTAHAQFNTCQVNSPGNIVECSGGNRWCGGACVKPPLASATTECANSTAFSCTTCDCSVPGPSCTTPSTIGSACVTAPNATPTITSGGIWNDNCSVSCVCPAGSSIVGTVCKPIVLLSPGTPDTGSLNVTGNVTAGGNLMVTGGKIGIGTPSPTGSLHLLKDGSNAEIKIQSGGAAGDETHWGLYSNKYQDLFDNSFNIWGNGTNRLTILRNGKVGIGTIGPTITLAVGDSDTGLDHTADGTLNLVANNESIMSIRPFNVGIGTINPDAAAKLDVNGQIKITGGSPGPNKVLTSDANGLATWADPTISTPTFSGLVTGNAGLTTTGAAVNLNSSSNFPVNIATGSSTGAVSIGGNSNTLAINTSTWDVSSAGDLSGLTSIVSSGNITSYGLISTILNVGGGAFVVNSSGNVTRIKSVIYDWPATQGAASSVLTNNGSGTLSWATPSSGVTLTPTPTTNYLTKFTSATSIGNSQIRDDGTNVGIGAAPVAGQRFTVMAPTGNGIYSNAAAGTGVLAMGDTGVSAFGNSVGVSGDGASYGVYGYGGTGVRAEGNVGLSAYGDSYGIQATGLYAAATFTGNVGIGTVNPLYTLDVVGTINVTPNCASCNGIQLAATGPSTGNFLNITSSSTWPSVSTARAINIDLEGSNVDDDVIVLQTDNTSVGTPADTTKFKVTAKGDVHASNAYIGNYNQKQVATLQVTGQYDSILKLRADWTNCGACEDYNSWIELSQDGGVVFSYIGLVGYADNPPDSWGSPFNTGYYGTLDNSTLIGSASAHPLQFGTNSQVAMTILSNGNVGIGTNSPTSLLDVKGQLLVIDDAYVEVKPGGAGWGLVIRDTDSSDYGNIDAEWGVLTIGFNTSDGPLYITNSGNVGIGADAPTAKFQVYGNTTLTTNPIHFTSSWNGYPDNNTTHSEISNDISDYKTLMIVGNKSAGDLRSVSVWDKLAVRGSQDVGLNKYGAFIVGNPDGGNIAIDNNEIMARNNGAAAELYLQNEGGNTHFGGSVTVDSSVATRRGDAGTSGERHLDFLINGVSGSHIRIGSITRNGQSQAITVNYTSDARLKEHIKHLGGALDTLLNVKPRTYNYIGTHPDHQSVGFIAQELYQTYPEAVTVGGADPHTDPWSVDYSRLTPLLTGAVQELNAEVESQQKTIDAQQEVINAQQKEIEGIKALLKELMKK